MKIVYVSQVFPPDPGPSLRAEEQARYLQRLGHDVTVVTTMSYYPSGRTAAAYRRKLHVVEHHDGVNVIRVWSLPAPNRGIARRVLSQMSFAVASFLVAARIEKPDLVIASTHILAIELAVIALARLKRCASLIELRDLLPESLALTGVRPASVRARLLRRYFDFCLQRADLVAVPSETMVPHLVRRGVDEDRIVLMPHGSDSERFARADPAGVIRRHGLEGRFVVVYAGSFSPYYDIPNIIRAATLVCEARHDVAFILIGDGHGRYSRECLQKEASNGNVILTGHVPPRSVVDYLSAADLCITSLTGASTPGFYRDYPTTKVCDYLMAGKPVLAVENAPVMGDYLGHIEAGEAVAGEDPRALARAVLSLCSDPERLCRYSENAYRHARAHMDRMVIVRAFDDALRARMGEK
ncbi:MAG: glycosyltransferase family 4 protein [Candidatus Krumholzibacteria bacterium]|nr:glycosyltransferase family 4 protein [Candidatus Krumholzibacteria bacterium]